MSKQYVLDAMKQLMSCNRDADFAREIGISRQALNSYKNSNADRITDRIVDKLLERIKQQDQEIENMNSRLNVIEGLAKKD